jgi:hypothetical protein
VRNRLRLRQARHDTRDWQVNRRERTRQLIELGGLVVKAELVALTDDDHAVILGILTNAATTLRSERRDEALILWQQMGQRRFGIGQSPKN